MLGLMALMLLLGPVEELGWRGVAQPILQRHMAPIWAGALIGAAWGLWHLPAFFLAGVVFENWSFLPFFIGNVTLAILVTPMFTRNRAITEVVPSRRRSRTVSEVTEETSTAC